MLFAQLGDGYQMVYAEEEADILWTAGHVKDFSNFQQFQQISQFPNEWLLTTKVPQFISPTTTQAQMTYIDLVSDRINWKCLTMTKSKPAASRLVRANLWFAIRNLPFRCSLRRYCYNADLYDITWSHSTYFDPIWPHNESNFRKRNKKSWQSFASTKIVKSLAKIMTNHNSLHDIKIYWNAILVTALHFSRDPQTVQKIVFKSGSASNRPSVFEPTGAGPSNPANILKRQKWPSQIRFPISRYCPLISST